MLLSWVIAGFLVLTTIAIHYEALRLLDWSVRRIEGLHRLRIVLIVLGCFVAHIIEVALFAVVTYAAATSLDIGTIKGVLSHGFDDYLHLSLESYTSLGLGDVYPTGHLRLLIGIEALIGLTMITWSASFTFLEMKSLWDDRNDPE
ncbi:MAG TPA: ion channel [Burkholderiales bacterium]|nr:ion channel [Burkholderiales bacterium]